jgi:hypothetical protein
MSRRPLPHGRGTDDTADASLRRADGRGLRSSFRYRGTSSRIPLNIRAGSHPRGEGTRLNGRLGKPCLPCSSGVVGAVRCHCTSMVRSNAHAATGHTCPETVKLCERYRYGGQRSILSAVYAHVSGCARTGRKTPVRHKNARVGSGVNAGTRDFAIYREVVARPNSPVHCHGPAMCAGGTCAGM